MASRRIPDSISQFRPGPCTEIKEISGHYYVYMYSSVMLPSGKWGKKTGKSIGTIVPEKGFIPNKNFGLYQEGFDLQQEEFTVLEYGQYALVYEVCKDIRESLEKFFPLDRAAQIFSYACIVFVNGFTHVDQIRDYYEQGWLSWENRNFAFKMGRTALGSLLDDLGRRTTRVTNYEKYSVALSSAMAIDGHAIRCCSDENDLGEAGYKFSSLKEDQVNLLMGYDIATGMPLFARIYRGSCNDSSTVPDLFDLLQFTGILFVIDRGFYSKANLALFSANDNTYIIPVPAKNKGDFNDLMFQDYYKEQGFSFIMLIAGQLHQVMVSRIKELNNNTLSVEDILLMARCMKMERRGNVWNLKNTRQRDLQILGKLGFEPRYSASTTDP